MSTASLIAKQASNDLLASAKPFDEGARKVNEIIPLLEKVEWEHDKAIYHLRNLVAYLDQKEGTHVNFTLDAAKAFLRECGHL